MAVATANGRGRDGSRGYPPSATSRGRAGGSSRPVSSAASMLAGRLEALGRDRRSSACSIARTNAAGRSARRSRRRVRSPRACACRTSSSERPGHGIAARDQVEEQRAERVDVGALIAPVAREAAPAPCNSGVPVMPRPRSSRGLVVVAGAEIHQHHAAAFFAHHVAGRDVAMQEPGAVHRGQRAAQVRADGGRLARAQAALLLDEPMQRRAADELHPDADAPVAGLGAVHRDHVRMAHAGEQASLVDDARGIAEADGWDRGGPGRCRSSLSATSRSRCVSQAR